MSALFDVVLPVFLVIGFGYVVAWRGLFSDSAVDGVMRFAQNFAVPVLLFAQVGLGIANVVMSLPLHLAVLHNAGATALLFVLVTLLARVRAPDA